MKTFWKLKKYLQEKKHLNFKWNIKIKINSMLVLKYGSLEKIKIFKNYYLLIRSFRNVSPFMLNKLLKMYVLLAMFIYFVIRTLKRFYIFIIFEISVYIRKLIWRLSTKISKIRENKYFVKVSLKKLHSKEYFKRQTNIQKKWKIIFP